MNIQLDHAIRAQWALAAEARRQIRNYLDRPKTRRNDWLGKSYLSTAKSYGKSVTALRAAIEQEITR